MPTTSTAAGWVLKREPGGHPKGSERDGTLSALVHCSGRGEIMAGWHVLHGEHHSLGCGGLILEACGDFGGVWGFWKCVGILEVCAYGTHEGCVRWSGGSCSGLGSRFSTPGRELGVTGDRGNRAHHPKGSPAPAATPPPCPFFGQLSPSPCTAAPRTGPGAAVGCRSRPPQCSTPP